MHKDFATYVESLHSSFERLMNMKAVSMSALPKNLPDKCVYLFSEGEQTLYVGRTRKLRQRVRQHSTPGAQHNQAVFAFRLAREKTGRGKAAYSTEGSRMNMCREPGFRDAFTEAKARVRNMELRFVEEADPLRQALLEIYVSVVLGTRHNDFDTH
jgi:predicted GIY-YIG superfamily endonuclease